MEPQKLPEGISISRSSEYSHCIVVSIDTEKVQTTTLALEFALTEHPSRFLTLGGETALNAAYNNLPIKSLVDRDKFISHHAEEYCASQEEKAQKVNYCLDTPPFVLNIATTAKKERSSFFWIITGGVVTSGLALSVFTASAVQSRLKEE